MRRARILAVAFALVVIALALLRPTTRDKRGHASTVQRVGAITTGTIGFALDLRLRQGALDAYLQRVEPGASRALTAGTFGARFGPSDAAVGGLRTVLERLGISVTHLYPQRTAMLVRAGVGALQRVFGLRFARYVLPDGRRFFAPLNRPRIPPVLTPYVTGLGDLSNRPVVALDIPASGLTSAVVTKAYDITPLWQRGFRGQGETIAIATAFGAINPADVQAFAQHNGIPAPKIAIEQVNGGSTYSQSAGSDGEVDLDLQTVLGVAPEAQIIDYQGPDGSRSQQLPLGTSLADIYNRIEQDGRARIVSTSYGLCEADLSPGDQQLMDNALKALEASSVTVFVSSGDSGAYACLQDQQIQPASTLPAIATGLAVQTPSSSPYAVSVGGTRLELRTDGSYLTESAWSQPLSRLGGGGGVSRSEPRPIWQQGPGVSQPALNPSAHRQLPDVSGPADPNSGFFVCQTQPGQTSPQCSGGSGGTSSATPFWAASMLLVQQYAAAHGAGALARCFAAPILYDLAAKPQPVPPFHHVTVGDNGFYSAGPAWSFATGLGSPDVFNLAQDYAAFLAARSSRTCPF